MKKNPTQNPQIPVAQNVSENELAAYAEAAARILGAPTGTTIQNESSSNDFVSYSPGPNINLWSAILEAQKAIKNPTFDKENKHTSASYASLGAVFEAVRDKVLDAGLVLFQAGTRDSEEQMVVRVLTRITHAKSGEYLEVISKIKMAKDDAQGFGSAFTYGKRYSSNGAFAIVGEVDDDGDSSSVGTKVARESGSGSDYKQIKTSGPVRKEGQAAPPSRSRSVEKELPKDPGPLENPDDQLLHDMKQKAIRMLQDGWGGKAKEAAKNICDANFGGKKIADLNMEETQSLFEVIKKCYTVMQKELSESSRG